MSLKSGETGVITSIIQNPEGQRRHRHRNKKNWKKNSTIDRCIKRLTDLGLIPGTEVTVIKSAPFNGPIEIFFRGSRLAIGRGMACRIGVNLKDE